MFHAKDQNMCNESPGNAVSSLNPGPPGRIYLNLKFPITLTLPFLTLPPPEILFTFAGEVCIDETSEILHR